MLTVLRFFLIPIYIVIFVKGHLIPAFLIVIAAGVTDILDGYIARRTGQITTVGIMLDPLADKLMIFTVMLSLLLTGYVSWAAAAAMFFRDLGMIAGGLLAHFRGKRTVPSNWMGKLTTVMLFASFMFIFFHASFAASFLWFVITFSYITSFIYLAQYRKLNKTSPVITGEQKEA